MNASQHQPNVTAAISVEPLPPARAALAFAIECFGRARERLDEAQRTLTRAEHLRAPVTSREAGELRAEMGRFYEITTSLNASDEGAQASLPAELDRDISLQMQARCAVSMLSARMSIEKKALLWARIRGGRVDDYFSMNVVDRSQA